MCLACRPAASATHKIDQIHRSGRFIIAAPCHVLVGADEHELARIEGPRLGSVNVEDSERDAPLRGSIDQSRDRARSDRDE